MRRLAVLALLMVVCAAVFASGRKSRGASVAPTDQRLYEQLYLEAACQREAGNLVAQYRLLQRAIEVNPRGAEAYFDLATMPVNTGADALDYLERAYTLAPQNKEYTFEYARSLLAQRDPRGVELMQALTADEDMREDVYAELYGYYQWVQDYDALCRMLEQWRPVKGDDEAISARKLYAAMTLGRLDDALLIADTLIALAPLSAMQYKVAKGEILLGLNRDDEALALHHTLSTNEEGAPGAQILLYKYAVKTGNKPLETETLKLIVGNVDMQMQTREAALRQYLGAPADSGRAARRDTLLAILLPLHDDKPQLYNALLADLAQDDAPDTLYLQLFNKLLEIDPANEYARISLMQLALRADDNAELQRLCTDGLKENPRQPLFYYFGGAGLMIAKKYDEALALFERGRGFITADTGTELVSSYFGSYGDALHQLGRKQEAYAMYDSALVYNNGNEMCLNNFAYFLALDGEQLDKAERMSAYTVETRPDEPTFLDTYAWILFLKGDYERAREYIDRAIAHIEDRADQDNSSLYDHAGDIYFHLGLVDEAVAFWRQALSLDGDSALLRKKIKDKRYYKD